MDGMALVQRLEERSRATPLIVITAPGAEEVAIDAMRAGAWDFLEKPLSQDCLELTVKRALETARLRRDNRRLRSTVERPILAESQAMGAVVEIADRVAASDATVLSTGEIGVGKELIARRIHAHSARGEGPSVVATCAAIPENRLESELFGHTEGDFTGAERPREGRFPHSFRIHEIRLRSATFPA